MFVFENYRGRSSIVGFEDWSENEKKIGSIDGREGESWVALKKEETNWMNLGEREIERLVRSEREEETYY